MKILILSFWMAVGGIDTTLLNLVENYPDRTAQFCLYSHVLNQAAQKKFEAAGVVVKKRHVNTEKFFVIQGKQVNYANDYHNLKDIFEVEKPDVVLACNYFDFISGAIAGLATGTPIIPVFHNAVIEMCSNFNSAHRPLWLKALEVTPYYAVSQAGANSIMTHLLGIPLLEESENVSVQVLSNGVPLRKFQRSLEDRAALRSQHNIPEDAIVIGDIGPVDFFHKRPYWIVNAVAYLHQCGFRNVYGMIVGEGWLQKLKNHAQDAGVEEFMVFTGKQKHTELYYNAFDIFAHASMEEQSSLVAIEALACSLPTVICTPYQAQSGIFDLDGIIENGSNGLVVYENDKEGFIRGIERLVKNKHLRDQFALVAAESVEKFDVQYMAQEYYEIFTIAAQKPRIRQYKMAEDFLRLVATFDRKETKKEQHC